MESMRSQLRGLRSLRIDVRRALWLEEETVSQTENRGSLQESPARRSTTSFSLSHFLWLRTWEMCTESNNLSMLMMSSVAVQKDEVLCSGPCVMSCPSPSLIKVLESPVMWIDLEFEAIASASSAWKASASASMLVLSVCSS